MNNNPAQVAGRKGFRTRGALGVHGVRERALLDAMTHAPMVE